MDFLSHFRRRLAETITWCTGRPRLDPMTDLRTPALLPPAFCVEGRLEPGRCGWDALALKPAVDAVVEARESMLRQEGRYPAEPASDLSGGRLLFSAPHYSFPDGVSESETRGFVDLNDVPPWDTWICWVSDPVRYEDARILEMRSRRSDWEPTPADFLLCWVPQEWIGLATAGIEINAYGCLQWALDYRPYGHEMPASLEALRVAGYLS